MLSPDELALLEAIDHTGSLLRAAVQLWRGDHDGRALAWWVEQFQQPRLAKRLVDGLVMEGG
jgi:hypothetical protein